MQPVLDILKELENIAARDRRTTLSEISGRRINLEVPGIDIITCQIFLEA